MSGNVQCANGALPALKVKFLLENFAISTHLNLFCDMKVKQKPKKQFDIFAKSTKNCPIACAATVCGVVAPLNISVAIRQRPTSFR